MGVIPQKFSAHFSSKKRVSAHFYVKKRVLGGSRRDAYGRKNGHLPTFCPLLKKFLSTKTGVKWSILDEKGLKNG